MDKLDILEKLIKLANNNPNEHEANSAARRVCKLLAELKVNFKRRNQPEQPNPRTYGTNPPTSADWFYDIFNNIHKQAQNDEKRRQEEQERMRERTAAQKRDEEFKKKYERHQANYNPNQWYYERPPVEVNIPPNFDPTKTQFRQDAPFDFDFRGGQRTGKSQKEKRIIICTQCKREFMSAYIGNIFVCHECHWDNYNASKK